MFDIINDNLHIIFMTIAVSITGATIFIAGWAFGNSRTRDMESAKLMTMRINCLYTRRNELQKILSDSENGRMIDKVSKRLQDVTNKILEIEG